MAHQLRYALRKRAQAGVCGARFGPRAEHWCGCRFMFECHECSCYCGPPNAQAETTGITGLARLKDPLPVLASVYEDTLAACAKMPATAAYRSNVEAITKDRLAVVQSTTDLDLIESKIGQGQIEKLVWEAEDELSLANKMLEWKPWEDLEEAPAADQWKWP